MGTVMAALVAIVSAAFAAAFAYSRVMHVLAAMRKDIEMARERSAERDKITGITSDRLIEVEKTLAVVLARTEQTEKKVDQLLQLLAGPIRASRIKKLVDDEE